MARIAVTRGERERRWNARRHSVVTSIVAIDLLCIFGLVPTVARASGTPLISCGGVLAGGVRAGRRTDPPDTTRNSSIVGVVRSGPLNEPLANAAVQIAELTAGSDTSQTYSDSAGAYKIDGLARGSVRMVISHAGYDTAIVQVTVPAHGLVRVDVTLLWTPVALDSIRVRGLVADAAEGRPSGGAVGPDTWQWNGDPAAAPTSTGEPDALRVLEADPHVAMTPESPAAMDRGGTADQLLVRIDGLPVWSPVHATSAGALGAVTPDAVSNVTLHDGAMPASLGDRLAGVLDIDTREPTTQPPSATLALGPADARAMWTRSVALGNTTAGLLIGGRFGEPDISSMPEAAGLRDHWADGLATGSVRFGGTTIRAVAVASSDHAVADDELTGDSVQVHEPRVPWHTQTFGLVWTQQLTRTLQLVTRLSQANLAALMPTITDTVGPSIQSAVAQSELSTQLSWGATALGVTVDVLHVGYHVTASDGWLAPGGGPVEATGALSGDGRALWLGGSPTITGVFVEHAWGPADSAWQVRAGIRGTDISGGTPRAEPRVDASVRVAPGVTGSVGFARLHQYVQSLRNTASPDGASLGIDLPIAAGVGGAPVAQGDAETGGVMMQFGPNARLTVDAYARQVAGLAVANPLSANGFAVGGFDRASARIRGLAGELDGSSDRLIWQAGYGLGTTVDRLEALAYHPSTELGQTGMIAFGLRFPRATQLRIASWAAAGQPAAGLTGTLLGHDDGDASTSAPGADRDAESYWLSTSPLPLYLRADIEVLRRWSLGHTNSQLTTTLTLANVFNHANVAMYVPRSAGLAPVAVPLLPRSVLIGATWAY